MEHHQHNHSSNAEHPKSDVHSPLKYTCPMHPQIVKDGPGNCPMHKEYIRYKPGVCPTCGMTLEKWEIDKMEKRNIGNSPNSNSHSGHSGSGSYGGSSGGHHH